MDTSKILEKIKKDQKLKKRENQKKYFKISSPSGELNIEDFLKSFNNEIKIEHKVEINKFYIVSINNGKEKEIKEVFEKYNNEINKEILKHKTIEEKHNLDFTSYFIELQCKYNNENIQEEYNSYRRMKNFQKSKFSQLRWYANVSNKKLIKECSKVLSSIYTIEEDSAFDFINEINKNVNTLFKEYPYTGSFSISSHDIFSINEILKNDSEELTLDLLKKDKCINGFLEKIEENKSSFYKSFNDKLLRKLINNAKSKINIESFNIKNLPENPTSEEISIVDDKILEIRKELDLENKDTITGRNPFEFLNVFNIENYDYDREKSIVREIADIFMAKYISEYKLDLLNKLEENFGNGKITKINSKELNLICQNLNVNNIGNKKSKSQKSNKPN